MLKFLYILILNFIFWSFCNCSSAEKKSSVLYQKQDSLFIEDLLNRADTTFDLGQANHYNLKAKALIERQLKKNVRTKGLLLHLARNLNNCGVFSGHLIEKSNPLNYHYRALGIAEIIADNNMSASIHNNIGFYFSNTKELGLALYHYDLAAAYYNKANNKHDIAYIYSNMAGLYFSLKDTSRALNYYHNAINTAALKTSSDKQILGAVLNNIGNIYESKKEYELAMDYFSKAQAIELELGDLFGLITTLQNKGETYKFLKLNDSAEYYLKKSYNMSDSLNFVEVKQRAIRTLVSFYKFTNNKKQLEYYTAKMNQDSSNTTTQAIKQKSVTDTSTYQKIKQMYKDSIGKNQNLF